MRLRHFVVFAVFPLLFCSCRVYLPSLEKFAIESSYFRIHSKVAYDDILILGDDPNTGHGNYMRRVLVDVKGIPEKNIVFMPEFTNSFGDNGRGLFNYGLYSLLFFDEYSHLLSQTRVVCIPLNFDLFRDSRNQISWIEGSNILLVLSAGNVRLDGRRDLWYPDHPIWKTETLDYNLYVMCDFK